MLFELILRIAGFVLVWSVFDYGAHLIPDLSISWTMVIGVLAYRVGGEVFLAKISRRRKPKPLDAKVVDPDDGSEVTYLGNEVSFIEFYAMLSKVYEELEAKSDPEAKDSAGIQFYLRDAPDKSEYVGFVVNFVGKRNESKAM